VEFTDWRYRLVDTLDGLSHKIVGDRREWFLCNLERRMYARRMKRLGFS
jgi:hypothetical protein